jgi:hypothetical protein
VYKSYIYINRFVILCIIQKKTSNNQRLVNKKAKAWLINIFNISIALFISFHNNYIMRSERAPMKQNYTHTHTDSDSSYDNIRRGFESLIPLCYMIIVLNNTIIMVLLYLFFSLVVEERNKKKRDLIFFALHSENKLIMKHGFEEKETSFITCIEVSWSIF